MKYFHQKKYQAAKRERDREFTRSLPFHIKFMQKEMGRLDAQWNTSHNPKERAKLRKKHHELFAVVKAEVDRLRN